MTKVVGVKFKNAGREYFFDPNGIETELNGNVIVETARGLEFGTIFTAEKEVRDCEIVKPLKKVVKIASQEDISRNQKNMEKRDEALKLCQEKVDKHKLEMKLTDAEYTFDNTKIIFYFTSDGRVDFRELVKDLASIFKMRIELRQIGARDEAKMLGGIGHCGKGLCCHTWLPDFEPVSIKMAKVQNLSLNPAKISGICGRLMCCLKFENDLYIEMKKGMPNLGEKVSTRDGDAIVVDSNILENKVKVRLIIEEGTKENDFQEKLGTELIPFEKDEIRRFGKKVSPVAEIKEEEIPEEIIPLLED